MSLTMNKIERCLQNRLNEIKEPYMIAVFEVNVTFVNN